MMVSPRTSTDTIRKMGRSGERRNGSTIVTESREAHQVMADQLYLSLWLNGFTEHNMLRHYERLLKLFPFSRLAQAPSSFKVIAIEYSEPPLLERALEPPIAPDQVLAAAREFEHADSC